ncbi:spore maturation protein A [Oscillospiraceae bacterium LTW-04]|nr:spore maturation protein A [Oscillospiraceae bacterium MB24-C1]
MMTAIFCVMLLGGIVFGALTGRMPQVSDALLKESGRAIELILSLAGNFCLWGGIMRIAEESKLTTALAHLASPVTCRLFKGLRPQGKAMRAISMNMVANLLGLGNAATPLGITAMKAMEEEERANGTATDNMVLFVAMNTASLQLLPTTTAMLRSAAGSRAPLDILPAVWVASAVSVLSGIIAAKLLSNRRNRS